MTTTIPYHEVSVLVSLNSREAREVLAKVSNQTALNYLFQLFKGNGWIVSFVDRGPNSALLLSSPKSPQVITLIVKCIVQPHKLTYLEAREELIDFENVLSPRYGCAQFAIIALNGISPEAEKLEQFNLLLHDWTYVEDLISHYSVKKIKEPRIQLFAHNKQTYKKVCKLMSRVKSVAVVQATGTGKSFLIAKLLQEFSGEKRLVMAPSLYVIDQLKEHIRFDANDIEFMTYARGMNLSQNEVALLGAKMIVLDEFHRCGAEEWGRGVQNILNAYPEAFKFGTSATPVRYMDNARDMSKELFGNNVAENLSLAQAIVRNILPMPKYVCALYSLREEVDNLRENINKSRTTEAVKNRLQRDLDTASINWELSSGVPAIFKKHLLTSTGKFIVFCRDEEHLFEMEPIVSEWFKKAGDDALIETYRVFDNEPKSYENLEAFKSANSGSEFHLLLSINMLNEGLHINEVSGVVLLRPTESPNIFYQQIGRCLKVGLNHIPIIFDLVNNFKGIRTNDFLHDLEFAHSDYAAERAAEDLKDNSPVFTIVDEVREITEVFGEIKFRIDNWDGMFEQLVEYKKHFGTCNVSAVREETEYRALWKWLHKQRRKFQSGLLEPQRCDKLIALGLEWKLDQLVGSRDERWEQRFQQLCEFREKYGHCNPGESHKEFGRLHAFASDQRYRYGLGTLEAYRIDKLVSIGFDFNHLQNYREGRWQLHFDELLAHKSEHGHLKVNAEQNRSLSHWLFLQRRAFRENKLDKVRQQKLNSIGFQWTEHPNTIFEQNVSKIIEWYCEHHHFKLPANSKLRNFCHTLREKYRDKTLVPEVILKLESIGFDFEIKEANALVNEKRLRQLTEFLELNGHVNVTKETENYEGLSVWLSTERKLYGRGVLKKEFIKKMEELGVDWKYQQTHLDDLWNSRYLELLALYKQVGKNYLVQTRQNESLINWCASQRRKYKKGELDKEQIEKLNAIDFKWDYFDAVWEENFHKLLVYKEKYGHCNITQNNAKTTALNVWCGNTRRSYKNGTLGIDKIKRLESIGFLWDVTDARWRSTYEALQKFLIKNTWEDLHSKDELLFAWVSQQRKDYKRGKLAEEKSMLLNMLGIPWSPGESNWGQMFNEFLKYRQTYNTGRVSYTDKSFKKLWVWCVTQRKRYRDNKIPPRELQLLNEAGFEWQVKGGSLTV